jgi:hypothetical protein
MSDNDWEQFKEYLRKGGDELGIRIVSRNDQILVISSQYNDISDDTIGREMKNTSYDNYLNTVAGIEPDALHKIAMLEQEYNEAEDDTERIDILGKI